MKKLVINKFLLLLLIFLSLFFNIILNYQNHWSGSVEDFTQVYNSLLLNSGIKAEFHDHPGHSLIYLNSLWLNFLDFFNIIEYSNFKEIYNIENINEVLNHVVAYSKLLNLVFSLSFLLIFYKFLKIFSNDKTLKLLFLLIFLNSDAFLSSINMFKAEFLSATCIFTFFYFITEFLNKKPKRKYIFFSGFFLCLAIFAKFQAIFVIFFLPLVFLYQEKKVFEFKPLYFENKYILRFNLVMMLLALFLIYIKYVKGINYFFLPIIIFYFFLLVYFIEKLFFKKKIKIIFFNYFLLGFYFCVLFLIAFKPFHTNNLNVIINGFGQASMFIQGNNPYSSDLKIFSDIILLSIKSFTFTIKLLFFKFSLLTLALTIIIFFIPISIFNKNKKNLIFALGTIFIIFTICFFFSVRPRPHYSIYIAPVIFGSLFILTNSILEKNKVYLIIIFALLINIFNVYKMINQNIYQTAYQLACVKEINEGSGYMYWWHKKIDKEFLIKACNLN